MVVSIINISPVHGSRYYTRESGLSEQEQYENSQWQGNLTPALGVSGAVNSKQLTCLLKGESLLGEPLVQKTQLHSQQSNAREQGKPVPKERAGLDLTSSAPKSVSLQALVFGEADLVAAHRQATERMLRFLEDHYACTRIRQNGQRLKVQTGQMAIAQFHHYTSRALDPQLHTHNLILNLQQRPDGQWQSLDNAAIYRARTLLGKVYRNELARAVQALGYEVEVTNSQHEFWELKGYTRQQLEQFSKRTQQIQATTGEDASSERKAWITMTSGRQAKQYMPQPALAELWQQEATAAGIMPIQAIDRRAALAEVTFDKPVLQETYDFQRNENKVSATDSEGGPRSDNSQPTSPSSTAALFDRQSIEQFRASLRAIAHPDQPETPSGCLGGLEPTNHSNCRADGAIIAMAEANASLSDYSQTDAGKSAAADRWDVYSPDDGSSGTGYPHPTPSPEPEPEATSELERDYH